MFGQPSPLVIDPNADPTERVLDEICAVLRKHGYVLGVAENASSFILGKISDGVGGQAMAVAEVRQIAPTHATWRPVRQSNAIKVIQ